MIARRLALFLALGLALGFASTIASAQDSSVYVTTKDGTRLAVDVHLPEAATAGAAGPALLELTRYWRAAEDPTTGAPDSRLSALDRFFLEHGYAVVKVDVRGSGASFGTRAMEYGRQEVRDGYDVVEWVVQQPWCDGAVGAYGTSYSGTTAELLTAVGHPAVKAVIPGWSDFDAYRSPARPYGLYMEGFIEAWGSMVGWMDDNESKWLGAHVRRVDEDEDGSLRAAAVKEHAANLDVAAGVKAAEFRDQVLPGGTDSFAHASSLFWKKEIEASGVPMLVLASWLDAGTADGALLRFRHFSNPQQLVILASNHGGGHHASPFVVGCKRVAPRPSVEEQFALRLDFLERHLRGVDHGVEDLPRIRYFNLGEEDWRETDVWPPAGAEPRRFHLREEGRLDPTPPTTAEGVDEYAIDFEVTTGNRNRWTTQMGGAVLRLDDRGKMDARMLIYTSAPLVEDLQVTGTPVVTLHVTSSATDGAFLVYLEDVDADGRSRYVTEGGLRGVHRRLVENPYYDSDVPYRSFAAADALPLVPGEPAELTFQLWPTSVLFRAGHRIRLAIAGADEGNFTRVPAEGGVTIRVSRTALRPSFIDLPVVESEGK